MSGNINPLEASPGTDPTAIISPSLQSLIIGQTFLVLLVPLLIALLYYSTPYSRRQPIFVLNVIALTLAFTAGIADNALTIQIMLSPETLGPLQTRMLLAIAFIMPFQGMLADTILLVRLITVHPLSRVGPVRFVLLTALPITLKVARVINLALYTNQLCVEANGPDGLETIAFAWLTGPYMKIEWIAQVVDNSYASIVFLWTIRGFTNNTVSNSLMLSGVTFRQSSFTERIRILFNIALSNFIIPTVMSIVQLAFIFRFGATNATTSMNDMSYVNVMVSVFGVVFATVWAGKEHQREANVSPSPFIVERGQASGHVFDGWRMSSHSPVINIERRQGDNTSSGGSDHDKSSV